MAKLSSLDKVFQRAAIAALKRSVRSGAVFANRLIRQEYRLSAGFVREQLKSRVDASELTGRITARGGRLAVSKFPHRGHYPSKGRGEGVRVTIKRAKGSRKLIRHSFIVKLPSGHIGVFVRKGPKRIMTQGSYKGKLRQPIVEVKTISIAEMFGAERIMRLTKSHIRTSYSKNLQHELRYRLARI